ncbi:zinc dependent phospholipase C family protein [bacterium]|nr:zinc dependent phospholipase C family protein [bacterium]MBU1025795.1 zinc dependent phospholipase C family protein [bacterium]
MLLYPIMPLLGWGPVTHAYINERVLKHLDEFPGLDDDVAKKALSKKSAEKYFVLTAGYPDIIKAKGFLNGDTSYDYAHNPLPNRYYGQPQFACDMFEDFKDSNDPELLVLALSWKAHQVADVFAHHLPIDDFWGYVNREVFFGPFWDEVLEHVGKKNLGSLPGAFYRADHWICELIIDLFCYIEMGNEWGWEMLSDAPEKPLKRLFKISEKYIKENAGELNREYGKIAPIKLKEILRGKKFSDALNIATLKYYDSLKKKRSLATLKKMINSHAKFSGLKETLDKVAWITAKSIMKPSQKWQAPVVNQELFLSQNSTCEDVFPGILPQDEYKNYFSEEIESGCRKFKPEREGIVKIVLEYTPILPIRWLVNYSPLITSGNIVNRMLLPKKRNSYSLALRYAFNIRERKEENLMTILRRSLEEADIIASK